MSNDEKKQRPTSDALRTTDSSGDTAKWDDPITDGDRSLTWAPNTDKPTETITVVELSMAAAEQQNTTARLVVIYAKEPMQLRNYFVLEHTPTRVGRAADNDIFLDSDSVSRRHAHFEWRGVSWIVVDDRSRNGTYCNDERISRKPLKNGDRVRIGHTIFKFLSGTDVEAKYHEEVYRMTITDGLTQVPNKQYLYEMLEREMTRGRWNERELAILLFDIDHFKRLNEVNGDFAGDFVLKELATVVQARLRQDQMFARYGGEEFAIVLLEASLEGAAALGETVRQEISEHLFVFGSDTIRITISIGMALRQEGDRGANDLLKRAEHALYIAKREGRNRVVLHSSVIDVPGTSTRNDYRQVIDGPSLLQKALTSAQPGVLLGFEVDEEAAIVEYLGAKVYEEWFHQLLRHVELSIGKEDTLATWRDRYVLALIHHGTAERAGEITARVRDEWTKQAVPKEQRAVTRQIRTAALTAAEFVAHRERALDRLVARLLRRAPTPSAPEDDLPFPIAALRAMISTRRAALGRVKALLDGIETALRFVVAIELATLRESDDPDLDERTAGLLVKVATRGYPWEMCALGLSSFVSSNQGGAIVKMAQALSSSKANQPLSKKLVEAFELRRSIGTQTGLSEDAYASHEEMLQEIFEEIFTALRPLASVKLVSVADINKIDDDKGIHYGLYLHKGPGEHFPIIRASSPFILQKDWCYLLRADGPRPLSLAPMVLSHTCKICGRIEVAIAKELALGPKGAKVNARGVTTTHQAFLKIPWDKRMQEFYSAWRTVREREGISNFTVGSVALGDGASAQGHVTQGSASSSQPQGQAQPTAAASQGFGRQQQAADTPIDFAILTAIEVERRAVCAAFGFGKDHRVKRSGRWYWRGQLPLADGYSYQIVVAQPAEMGQVEATALTKDVLRDWQPSAALLVGIAASTDPKKVKLGDVVVGKSVWYYEHGKVTPEGTKPQPEMMQANAGLLQHFTGMDDWDGKVAVERPDGSDVPPKVHAGVIASGEKVIADAAVRDEIASGHRKIMALAMEDYGFARAIGQSTERVQHLVIRGICDDGSPAKDDRWHAYAAAAAARLAKHFLLDRPLESRVGSPAPRP